MDKDINDENMLRNMYTIKVNDNVEEINPNSSVILNISKPYPDIDEIVDVKIKECTDFGYYGLMTSYNLEGLILLSEVSRRKANSKLKIGDIRKARVIKVDNINRYYDLSIRQVV